MKVCALLLAAVACAVSEPPVDRSYLPPSSQYGAPAPGMQFGARSPSAQYGAPAVGTASFGRSSGGSAARVSSSFGSASSRRFGGAGRRFGSAAAGGLSTQYGAPSAGAGFGGLGLSSQSYSSGALSTQYGAPSVDSGFGRSAGPSPVYGVPGYGRAGAQEDALAEPANYEFSYSVEDANTLSDFGQEESRQGESAQGQYRVLLPDGRKQIVTYQADEGGYRPTIEYEDTGLTAYSAGGYGYGRGRAGAGAGAAAGDGNGGYHY
ncbi:pro-resilin-like [Schistocerca serialis cubense]|uniref:pro-resilin-like n=1 Tax=Schistocerca serialis cubense TaxID=2023355 RepID=UPI00214F4826|nr:pro-resilin-like [Schistocerca serialis cubense]